MVEKRIIYEALDKAVEQMEMDPDFLDPVRQLEAYKNTLENGNVLDVVCAFRDYLDSLTRNEWKIMCEDLTRITGRAHASKYPLALIESFINEYAGRYETGLSGMSDANGNSIGVVFPCTQFIIAMTSRQFVEILLMTLTESGVTVTMTRAGNYKLS